MDDDRGAGWLTFASIILIFAGLMRILDALWAFSVGNKGDGQLSDALLGSDISTYGWWFLLVGVVLIGKRHLPEPWLDPVRASWL